MTLMNWVKAILTSGPKGAARAMHSMRDPSETSPGKLIDDSDRRSRVAHDDLVAELGRLTAAIGHHKQHRRNNS